MIVHLWEWQFKVEKLSSVHVASFNRRRQQAERRLLRCEKDFWTMADPEIDAWMLVTGRTRDVFDLEAFAKTYGSEYLKLLLRIRKIVDVRVMPEKCPMQRMLQKINGDDVDAEEVDVQLNSKTFTTTIKK